MPSYISPEMRTDHIADWIPTHLLKPGRYELSCVFIGVEASDLMAQGWVRVDAMDLTSGRPQYRAFRWLSVAEQGRFVPEVLLRTGEPIEFDEPCVLMDGDPGVRLPRP